MNLPFATVRPWAWSLVGMLVLGLVTNCGEKAPSSSPKARKCLTLEGSKDKKEADKKTDTKKDEKKNKGTKNGTDTKTKIALSLTEVPGESDDVTDVELLDDATEEEKSPDDTSWGLAKDEKTYTYDDDIKPLFKNQCISCHSKGGTKPALDTYDDAKANIAKAITTMQGETPVMPPSGVLPATEVAKLVGWQLGKFLKSPPVNKDTQDPKKDQKTSTSKDPSAEADTCKAPTTKGTSTKTAKDSGKNPKEPEKSGTGTKTSTGTKTK